ncbi:Polyribonucleotide nucleotidyltransferase 1, mitochondrial [Trichoplax sp. H2]|nr:Polyribonucleotide nucleotidyltransferase 1, mitochondrial [Trichoplax sp. H2]|eukprot:RDD44858.1 Polyribonucleotide nucleotidyltransferase 1, mitochondrial [Trichoplax sp. H2]
MPLSSLSRLANIISYNSQAYRYGLKIHRYCREITRRYNHAHTGCLTTVSGKSEIKFSCGKLATIADGSVLVETGSTAVLVTAVMSRATTSYAGFAPLRVDYREKASATGKIPVNFFKRELGPSEREILASRSIDRSIRSSFQRGMPQEVQIVCSLMSADAERDTIVPAINGASAALTISNIPWNGPIGAVRVGYINDEVIINPTRVELYQSKLDLVIVASAKGLVMLEGTASELPDAGVLKAITYGLEEAQNVVKAVEDFGHRYGKDKTNLTFYRLDESIKEGAYNLIGDQINDIMLDFSHKKLSRDRAARKVVDENFKTLQEMFPNADNFQLSDSFSSVTKRCITQNVMTKSIRCDGRGLNDLRPIDAEINIFPALHGSSLFKRGESQIFTTAVLGSKLSLQRFDITTAILGGERHRSFILHYEFPPYANNEIGRVMENSRREIGHGTLAKNALRSVVSDDFPFTVRLTGQVLMSNGSTSMASACGGSLALMDAGVPISRHIAGVAMGLVANPSDDGSKFNYKILTDIAGIEDYFGEMDFKIAGSREGITSLQADFKVTGVSMELIEEAIKKSAVARGKVLDIMYGVIDKPRLDVKSSAPVFDIVDVPAGKRFSIVGLGGVTIKGLQEEYGCDINFVDEDKVSIYAPSAKALANVKQRIEELMADLKEPDLKFSQIYTGKIVDIKNFGVMLEIEPNTQPILLHVSQLDHRRVSRPELLGYSIGHEMTVKCFGRDPITNRYRLSRKALLPALSSSIFSPNSSTDPKKKETPSKDDIKGMEELIGSHSEHEQEQ